MRFSQLYAPTLKESPTEAEVISHKLLLRAGMIRKVAAGIYSFLPLGFRVLRKIENIVREEMDRIGAQQILMSALQPSELWKKSDRWNQYGPEMMRLKDRGEREFALGPTHEELVTTLVMNEARSYRQLPITVYQIQVKFRDEIRPRFGLMRGREFIMKDAYSFNANQESLQNNYDDMYRAYSRIFSRTGLDFRSVEAASGLIGGKVSQEFMVLAESGEDTILYCNNCSYAASQDVAKTKLNAIERSGNKPDKNATKAQEVTTPGMKSVEEVSKFLNINDRRIVKTLMYKAGTDIVAVLVRGDRDVNDEKLSIVLGTTDFQLLTEAEWQQYPKLIQGFVGPVGLDGVRVIADNEISVLTDFVVGANKKDTHIMNVNSGKDFLVNEWTDVKKVVTGDKCPECDGKLTAVKGIEVGHIFQLGTKYSEVMGATFTDEDGSVKPFIMGCYGIGVSRTVAAAIEQNNDESGIIWPVTIAPYEVSLIVLGYDKKEQRDISDKIYGDLEDSKIEVIMDDRDESAGKKFADSDLIGFPVQVVIGARSIKNGMVEIKIRSTGKRLDVSIDEAVDEIIVIVSDLYKNIHLRGDKVV